MRIGLDISVLNDSNRTGIAVYTYELIKALLEEDREDTFVLFGIATLSTFDYLKNIDLKKYPNVEMRIKKMPSKFFRRTFIAWQKLGLPKIENLIGKVDIFQSFNWYYPPQKGGISIATVFDTTVLLNKNWHQEKTLQLDSFRFKRIAKHADLIITISRNSKKDFQKFYPNTKVEVIYPGVSNNFLKKTDSKTTENILKKYNLEKGYFLSVATLEPRKNLDFLIKNFLETKLGRPLVLVGGAGWKSEHLKNLAAENPGKIILTGFVPDDELPVLYQQALCLVYPSLYEGFGIPVLEAMSSGTPVISSNTSSLPEVGGNAVLYIDPMSDSEMQKALIKISTDERIRKSLIEKGLKQANAFSWSTSAKKLLKIYRELSEKS